MIFFNFEVKIEKTEKKDFFLLQGKRRVPLDAMSPH